MNRTLKLIVIFTIIVSSLLVVWANTNFSSKVDSATEKVTDEAQRKLYVNNCARCHGADGKADTTLGRSLDTPDLTTSAKGMSLGKVKSIIAKGDGSMPAFGKKLKAAEITALAKYVRSL